MRPKAQSILFGSCSSLVFCLVVVEGADAGGKPPSHPESSVAPAMLARSAARGRGASKQTGQRPAPVPFCAAKPHGHGRNRSFWVGGPPPASPGRALTGRADHRRRQAERPRSWRRRQGTPTRSCSESFSAGRTASFDRVTLTVRPPGLRRWPASRLGRGAPGARRAGARPADRWRRERRPTPPRRRPRPRPPGARRPPRWRWRGGAGWRGRGALAPRRRPWSPLGWPGRSHRRTSALAAAGRGVGARRGRVGALAARGAAARQPTRGPGAARRAG